MKKERLSRLIESAKQALEHAEGKSKVQTTDLIKSELIKKKEMKELQEKLKPARSEIWNLKSGI